MTALQVTSVGIPMTLQNDQPGQLTYTASGTVKKSDKSTVQLADLSVGTWHPNSITDGSTYTYDAWDATYSVSGSLSDYQQPLERNHHALGAPNPDLWFGDIGGFVDSKQVSVSGTLDPEHIYNSGTSLQPGQPNAAYAGALYEVSFAQTCAIGTDGVAFQNGQSSNHTDDIGPYAGAIGSGSRYMGGSDTYARGNASDYRLFLPRLEGLGFGIGGWADPDHDGYMVDPVNTEIEFSGYTDDPSEFYDGSAFAIITSPTQAMISFRTGNGFYRLCNSSTVEQAGEMRRGHCRDSEPLCSRRRMV